MSRATCRIYAADAVAPVSEPIAWSVYEGTSDCQPIELAATSEQAWNESRVVSREPCGDEGVPVIIHTCYGSGWEWRGRACLEHMVLTAGDGCMGFDAFDALLKEAESDPALYTDAACWWRHRDKFAKQYVIVKGELARKKLEAGELMEGKR